MNGTDRMPLRPGTRPPAPRPSSTPARVVRARPPVRKPTPRTFPRLIYASAAAVWLVLFAAGLPYYRLDAAARPQSPLHGYLKPNGEVGIVYGYAGTLAILVLLAYSARKRWRFLRGLGVLSRWLNVHIFCGIAAPALITLHSSFKQQGAIAVGYWAMIGVMLSGFVGFYIYKQIPRALAAGEDATQTLRKEAEGLEAELSERYGLQAELQVVRRAAGAERAAGMGALAALFFLLAQDLRERCCGGHAGVPEALWARLGRRERRRLQELVRRRLGIERRQAFLRQSEKLFAYWHAIHKPFAILLFVTMGLHIGVAIWLGYAWPWK